MLSRNSHRRRQEPILEETPDAISTLAPASSSPRVVALLTHRRNTSQRRFRPPPPRFFRWTATAGCCRPTRRTSAATAVVEGSPGGPRSRRRSLDHSGAIPRLPGVAGTGAILHRAAPGFPTTNAAAFRARDYTAEVWLNGLRAGSHEGGESPFVLDVTTRSAQARTRLAVAC